MCRSDEFGAVAAKKLPMEERMQHVLVILWPSLDIYRGVIFVECTGYVVLELYAMIGNSIDFLNLFLVFVPSVFFSIQHPEAKEKLSSGALPGPLCFY